MSQFGGVRSWAWSSLVAALVLVALGCERRAPPRIDAAVVAIDPQGEKRAEKEVSLVGDILINVRSWPERLGPAPLEQELREHLLFQLGASSRFEVPPFTPPADTRLRPLRLRVEYGLDVGRIEGKSVVQAAVLLKLEWSEATESRSFDENLLTETPVLSVDEKNPDRLREIAKKHLERTLSDAIRGLVLKEGVRSGDLDAVLSALEGQDMDLLGIALAAISDRHLTNTAPRLIELLHSPDPLLRDGAIGALVALGDPRAIKAITELAKFEDGNMMRRVIDAVATIGGDEARAYLEFVASGADNPVIKELAVQALERLDRGRSAR